MATKEKKQSKSKNNAKKALELSESSKLIDKEKKAKKVKKADNEYKRRHNVGNRTCKRFLAKHSVVEHSEKCNGFIRRVIFDTLEDAIGKGAEVCNQNKQHIIQVRHMYHSTTNNNIFFPIKKRVKKPKKENKNPEQKNENGNGSGSGSAESSPESSPVANGHSKPTKAAKKPKVSKKAKDPSTGSKKAGSKKNTEVTATEPEKLIE